MGFVSRTSTVIFRTSGSGALSTGTQEGRLVPPRFNERAALFESFHSEEILEHFQRGDPRIDARVSDRFGVGNARHLRHSDSNSSCGFLAGQVLEGVSLFRRQDGADGLGLIRGIRFFRTIHLEKGFHSEDHRENQAYEQQGNQKPQEMTRAIALLDAPGHLRTDFSARIAADPCGVLDRISAIRQLPRLRFQNGRLLSRRRLGLLAQGRRRCCTGLLILLGSQWLSSRGRRRRYILPEGRGGWNRGIGGLDQNLAERARSGDARELGGDGQASGARRAEKRNGIGRTQIPATLSASTRRVNTSGILTKVGFGGYSLLPESDRFGSGSRRGGHLFRG